MRRGGSLSEKACLQLFDLLFVNGENLRVKVNRDTNILILSPQVNSPIVPIPLKFMDFTAKYRHFKCWWDQTFTSILR